MKTTGLKTWEMLKLANSNQAVLVRPANSKEEFSYMPEWDLNLYRNFDWDILLPPSLEKSVTITRAQLADAFRYMKKFSGNRHVSDFELLCKELGLGDE